MLAISGGIAFALTWFVWKEEADPAEKAETTTVETTHVEKAELTKTASVYAPMSGNVIPVNEIPDDTFASGVLGNGVGIEPKEGVLVAPCDGVISTVAETKHAIGMEGPKGTELLMHIGIDTVRMNGDGFEVFVAENDKVVKGQKLVAFDIEKIKKAGFSTTTAVLVNNSDDYEAFQVVKTGNVEAGQEIIRL